MRNYLLEMEPEEGTSAWELKNEGKQEERLEVAKNLKKEGVAVAIICKATGLTEEEVKGL
jgi:predicted transposase/invertase (TIGR01784 family)